MTRLFRLAVDMPETSTPDKDTSVRIMDRQTEWKRTLTDREPGADLLVSLRYLELDVFSLTADKLNRRQAFHFALRLHYTEK